MRAGRLRHTVQLEQRVETRDTDGSVLTSWALFSERPAELRPLAGRELIAAQAVQSEITTRAVIRHIDGISTRMRLVHHGVAYNIHAVLPGPTFRRYCTLMLSAGVNNGQ